MNNNDLWDRLMLLAKEDAEYQQALARLKAVEAEYQALLETLCPEHREVLEQYIAACEEMDETLVFAAYQIGLADASGQ